MKRIAVLILASLRFTSGAKRCVSSEPPKPVSLEVHPPAVEIKAHPRKESACSQREVPIVEFVLFEDDEPIEFTEQDKRDIKALAQMANGEYFLIDTPEHKVQCAAVMWCACWRSMYGASKGFNSTIESVCSQPYQFF